MRNLIGSSISEYPVLYSPPSKTRWRPVLFQLSDLHSKIWGFFHHITFFDQFLVGLLVFPNFVFSDINLHVDADCYWFYFTFLAVTCNDQYCYYLTKSEKSWSEALEECRNFNADLLSIHNAADNQWISNKILAKQDVDQVHLGM